MRWCACYGAFVRTTLALADDIHQELKRIARARNVSLTRVANDVLRAGLGYDARLDDPRRYRQRVFELGNPTVNLDHSVRIAAALEDEETTRELDAYE